MFDAYGEVIAMLPWFMMPVPVESPSLQDRVQRLEGTVLLLLEVVQTLVEKVDQTQGTKAGGDHLGLIAGASSGTEAIALVDAIDHEIKSGNKSVAVRKMRDEFGCTWDQALHYVGQWESMSRKDRIRYFRISKLLKCLEAASGQAEEKSAQP